MRVAADARRKKHADRVREVPLKEGQIVLLWEQSVRGLNKIQDCWNSIRYRVLKTPTERGSMYTIALEDNLSKIKHVHRTLLKHYVATQGPERGLSAKSQEETESLQRSGEEEREDDWVLVSGPFVQAKSTPMPSIPETSTLALVLLPSQSNDVEGGASRPEQSATPASYSPVEEREGDCGLRRTVRATAGRHSNLYNLPRAVWGRERGAVNSQMIVPNAPLFFRPWD